MNTIWNDLLPKTLDELQTIARSRCGSLLVETATGTYVTERAAEYGTGEFYDDGALRNWLYYRLTGTTEGDAFRRAFAAAD